MIRERAGQSSACQGMPEPAKTNKSVPPLPDAIPSWIPNHVATGLLVQEHEKLRAILTDWMIQQRKLYADHVAQQERLVEAMLGTYSGTLRELGVGINDVAFEPRAIPPNVSGRSIANLGTGADYLLEAVQGTPRQINAVTTSPKAEDLPSLQVNAEPDIDQQPGAAATKEAALPDIEALCKKAKDETGALDQDRTLLDCWVRCSGIHTVQKWVKNYRKHPAGWAALLMIHGIPEVTARLRSKVENYAIYSALFLSVSIGLLTDPPGFAANTCKYSTGSGPWWECQIRKRLYLYLLAIGTASHMLSIVLGMAFINALNEAARDSDVYRMFSRGKGFLATVKCEKAFGWGCVTDFLAMVVSVQHSMGWDSVPLALILLVVCIYVYRKTAGLLFSSASLVKYWREELGGKPDKDDPYDLTTPISCFDELVKLNKDMFMEGGILSGSQEEQSSAVWSKLREADSDDDDDKEHHHKRKILENRNHMHESVAAMLF